MQPSPIATYSEVGNGSGCPLSVVRWDCEWDNEECGGDVCVTSELGARRVGEPISLI
jgi:hypothetical protein